jgi:hypothetical protein
MDKQTFIFLYLFGVFAVLFLKELCRWLKEEKDEDAHLVSNGDSQRVAHPQKDF